MISFQEQEWNTKKNANKNNDKGIKCYVIKNGFRNSRVYLVFFLSFFFVYPFDRFDFESAIKITCLGRWNPLADSCMILKYDH